MVRFFDQDGNEIPVIPGDSWGFAITSDGQVQEWRNGEEVEVDPLRAAELLGSARSALGESISDAAGLPRINEG